MTVAPETPRRSFDDVEGALAILREQGLRVSSARRLVLQSLFAGDGPASAEAIAGRTGLALDLASVYRNLETLETHGLVRHLHLGHGPGLYALAGEQRELLLCESCFRYIAVESGVLDGVRDALAEATCWQARFSHFPLTGLCPDCA
jgi:Fur family transcriptional regulator, ferric uptake regulator